MKKERKISPDLPTYMQMYKDNNKQCNNKTKTKNKTKKVKQFLSTYIF